MTDPTRYPETIEAVRIVGVTRAPGYPGNLLDLLPRIGHQLDADTDAERGDRAVILELVRDLDNAHDLNATAVRLEGRHLGHLPAEVAARWAPLIDAGIEVIAVARWVAVDLDHRDRPGLDIIIGRRP